MLTVLNFLTILKHCVWFSDHRYVYCHKFNQPYQWSPMSTGKEGCHDRRIGLFVQPPGSQPYHHILWYYLRYLLNDFFGVILATLKQPFARKMDPILAKWSQSPNCEDIPMSKSILVNKHYRTWLLVGWQPILFPINPGFRNTCVKFIGAKAQWSTTRRRPCSSSLGYIV